MIDMTAVQLSTRGTVGPDHWFVRLVDRPVPPSYHL